jgi:hypothetical protein
MKVHKPQQLSTHSYLYVSLMRNRLDNKTISALLNSEKCTAAPHIAGGIHDGSSTAPTRFPVDADGNIEGAREGENSGFSDGPMEGDFEGTVP